MNDVESRFWAKVDRTTECWIWTASTFAGGYGQFSVAGTKVYAHRFAFELLIGPIPDGLEIDHLCRVRHCVNPSHLEAVTHRENVLRGQALSAHRARKTHCPAGHRYDDRNTYRSPTNHRSCRRCKAEAARLRRARKVAA